MKGESASLLKKIIAALSSKKQELRVRITIFFLLHKNMDKRSLVHSFSHSLQALVADHPYATKKIHGGEEEDRESSMLMNYDIENYEEGEEDEDLTCALFKESKMAMEEDEEAMEGREEVDVVVKHVVEVREENVDEAADLFIKRFKREILLHS